MPVAREKLKKPKYKIYLVFWIVYWSMTGYYFFSHAGAVLGTAEEEGVRPVWILLFLAVTAFFVFSVVLCFKRWGSRFRLRTAEHKELIPRAKWYHYLLLVLMDVYCFFVIEMMNNAEKWTQIRPLLIWMNLLGGLIMILIMFFGYNSIRRACMTMLCFTITMSLIFYFVYATRGEPLQLIDIFNLKTAMGVAKGYEFVFTRWVTVFLCTSLSLIGIIMHSQDRRLAKKVPGRILMRVGAAGFMIFGYWFYLNTSWNVDLGITADLWAPHDTYEECGTNVGFFCVGKFMKNDPPQGYSANKVRQIAQESEEEYEQWDAKPQPDGITPVNIIAIMNESWADYRHVNPDLKTNIPYMPYFDSMDENIVKGSTMVCIISGGTAKSEYEFLTGNSVRQYPGLVPYVNFYTHDQYSLVSTLKAQGYEAVAMHPNKGTNWNRAAAYQYLGFDRFLTIDDFQAEAKKIRGMISDRENYEKIVELVNEKEDPNDPLFIFNVTMQNHGGYSTDNYKNDVFLEGLDDDAVNRFLSLEKNTDEATEYLIEYFKNVKEPTMIIMFGDHYPGLEQIEEFLSGSTKEDLPDEKKVLYYETPFFIWTNYESETVTDVITSCSMLGTMVLEKTGLEMTPYNHYLELLQTSVKGYNHIGYYDGDGVFHSWEGAPEEILNKRLEYEYFQYNSLVEKKNRTDWFYKIKGE